MNSLQPQAGRRMFVFLLSPVCGRHGRSLPVLSGARRLASRASSRSLRGRRVAPPPARSCCWASSRDLYAPIALTVMGVH